MDRNTGIKVYSVAALSAVLIGFSFLAIKTALMYSTPLEAIFYRFVTGFGFAVILVLTKMVKVDLKGKNLKKLIAPALLYSCGFFGFQFFGLMYISSVEAGIIMAIQPALAMVIAELAIKEKPNIIQRICVFVAIISVIFISVYGSGGIESVDIRGVILIFLSVLSMAVNIVYIRWIREDYSSIEVSFVSCGFGFFVYSAVILFYGGINGTLGETLGLLKNPEFITAILYLGIGCTMLTTLMNSYTVKHLEAVRASVIGCAGTIITLLAGFFILGEELSILQIFCSVIILASVVGTNYFRN